MGKEKIGHLLYPLVLGLSEVAMQVKLSAMGSSGRRGQSGPGVQRPRFPLAEASGPAHATKSGFHKASGALQTQGLVNSRHSEWLHGPHAPCFS